MSEKKTESVRAGELVTYRSNTEGTARFLGIVAGVSAKVDFADKGRRVEEVDIFTVAHLPGPDASWVPLNAERAVKLEMSEVTRVQA